MDNEEQGPLLKWGPSRPTVNLFMCRLDTAFIYCFYLFIGQLGERLLCASVAGANASATEDMLLTGFV